jgi:enterochelin esterase-like enzyme
MHTRLLGFLVVATALCQAQTGTTDRIQVHAKTLENNLTGDWPDREVSVYLPPSYTTSQNRRYPVVYVLHGFTDSDELWMGFKKHWINLPQVIDRALAAGDIHEMIVVMPNAYTRYQGSMYSNSPTNGNWEDFIVQELVPYVDDHYRTFANSTSRGIAGHSMGGYGAAMIAMKHPGVFSCAYLLSPWGLTPNFEGDIPARAAAVHTPAEFDQADFDVRLHIAAAAAWSPNPNKPPLYLDLPVQGEEIRNKWVANSPMALIDQYAATSPRLKAFVFDAGKQDKQIAAEARQFDVALTQKGIPHNFELYDGDHTNHVASRIQYKALPFFSRNLKFSK